MIRSGLALALAAACIAAAAAPPVAGADVQHASLGDVDATFSFTRPGPDRYRDLRVTVRRRGQVLVDGPVTVPGCVMPFCMPGGGRDADSIAVRDLAADGEPEVLLDLFTGGAHCCVVTRLYWFDGVRYRSLVHDWGDLGYGLRDLGAGPAPELVSGDDRFSFAFASFAGTVFPFRAWSFSDGALRDVTRSFPGRTRADAARAWRLYRKALRSRGRFEVRGAIAAWAADRYLLGRRAATRRRLRALARRRALPGEPPTGQAAFVRRLDRTLRRWGYAPRG